MDNASWRVAMLVLSQTKLSLCSCREGSDVCCSDVSVAGGKMRQCDDPTVQRSVVVQPL